MKTLTVTAARQRLGYWLKRAGQGEEIGIIAGAELFTLRKTPIAAGDYMETEYGLTKEEADRAAARILAEPVSPGAVPLDKLAAAVAARRRALRHRKTRDAA